MYKVLSRDFKIYALKRVRRRGKSAADRTAIMQYANEITLLQVPIPYPQSVPL